MRKNRARGRGPPLIPISIAACGFSACTLFVNLDGFTGTPAPDAGIGTGDANDAGQADTNNTNQTDANECDGATFCDDFDELPLGARWTRRVVDGGASMVLDPAGQSPPNALLVTIPELDASSDSVAILVRELGVGKRLTCAFDLDLIGGPSVAYGRAEMLTLQTSGVSVLSYALQLRLDHGALTTDPVIPTIREDIVYPDGGCDCPKPSTYYSLLPFPKSWVHVTLVTDFSTISVYYGPTLILGPKPIGGFEPVRPLTLTLGLQRYGGKAGARARFDNVVCTVDP